MRVVLAQQIEEVGTTLIEREADFSRQIARQKLGSSLAEYRTRRLAAAHRTLQWLQRHEVVIRERCPELFGGRT